MYSSQSSSEEAYEIYDFIEYKRQKGKQYMLVWWKGYPKQQATWQPIQNLQSTPDYQQYYENLKSQYQLKNSKKCIKRIKLSKKPSSLKVSLKQKAVDQIYQSEQQQKHKNEKQINSGKNGFQYVKQCEKDQNNLSKDFGKYLTKIPVSIQNKKDDIQKQKKALILLQQQSSYSSVTPDNKTQKINESQKKKASLSPQLLNDISTQNDQFASIEPVKFSIKLKETTKLMFRNEQLSAIKDICIKNNQILYLVEFNNSTFKEPIYLHETYLKLLWPRKFAEFLLSKIKN